MPVEISRETFNYTQEKSASSIQYISDCDIIVPDSKPDVLKVLEVSAYEQINEKNISKDYITLSGVINHNILYISDDDTYSLNSITYTAPFSRQLPAGGASDECVCKVTSSLVHIEHSIHNSRKLNVKCAVNINASVYEKNEICALVSVDDLQTLPCITKSIGAHNVFGISEHTFHIDEICHTPEHLPISEILKCKLTLSQSEIKTVANKAVIKGSAFAGILYLSDGAPAEAGSEIPFTQIIDIDGDTSDANISADFALKNISVSEELDTDATMTMFHINADVLMTLTLSDEKTIRYVSDIYSPDFELNVSSSDVCINSLEDSLSTQCVVNDRLNAEPGEIISRIYCLDTKAYADQTIVSQNSVTVKGFINASLVYGTDEAQIKSVYKQIPFSTELALSKNIDKSNVKCICEANSESSGYNIDTQGSVNIREVLKIHCDMISENKVSVINDVDYDENLKIDKSNQAGITVYFVQSGDSMWDIAKRYNTTEKEILSVNKLEEDINLSPGQQLIIPKRY